MDGLAVERAANAANADSAKNSTPIQPEDRQPNESLRRRKGAGPPTIVPMLPVRGRMRGGMRGEMRGGRKDWSGNNQGHWNSSQHWKTQDNQQCYGTPSSTRPSSQSVNGGVFHASSSYPWNSPWPDKSSSSRIANHDVGIPHPPIRRGRPLPLPPRQDNHRPNTRTSPVDAVNKPYSNNLPALKPRPAFSGIVAMRTPKPSPTAPGSFSPGVLKEQHGEIESPCRSLEREGERGSSPKRRKIDNTQPALISNAVGEDISSKYFAQTTPPPKLRIPDEGPSTSTTTPELLVTPLPSKTRMMVSTPIIKREPESPSPLTEERKIVTTYVTRFPLPENCQKTNPEWQTNRMAFRQEKARELFNKGLQLIGRCIIRDDGICIEWKSTVPLWSDTLEPVSLADDENPSPDHGGSHFSTPTKPTSPVRSHTDDAMGPPSTRRTTNVVESPSSVLPSNSPSRVSQHALALDVQSVATASPSPTRSDASRKSQRSRIQRGNLDLATAIELSQRTNATPTRPQAFKPSSATLSSPSALTTPYLSYPTIHPSYPAVTSPSVGLSRSKHRDANPSEEANQASKGQGGADDDDDDEVEIIEVPEQSRMAEAVKAGWTVIEDICQSSEKGSSEQAEDDFDELVEDNELKETRVDERPNQVAPVSMSMEDIDEDDDTLARNFINGYMQLFETDRDSLVSLYAPDAILRYRLLDIAQLPSTSPRRGLSSFPFMTARGHKEISSSLLTLDYIHFYQKVDEDGKNKIDLEYHREQTHDHISLYVRSTMTVDEDNGVPGTNEQSDTMEQQQKRLVDHDFWLHRVGSTRSRSAVTEGHGPFLIRSHLIIMHEAPL